MVEVEVHLYDLISLLYCTSDLPTLGYLSRLNLERAMPSKIPVSIFFGLPVKKAYLFPSGRIDVCIEYTKGVNKLLGNS